MAPYRTANIAGAPTADIATLFHNGHAAVSLPQRLTTIGRPQHRHPSLHRGTVATLCNADYSPRCLLPPQQPAASPWERTRPGRHLLPERMQPLRQRHLPERHGRHRRGRHHCTPPRWSRGRLPMTPSPLREPRATAPQSAWGAVHQRPSTAPNQSQDTSAKQPPPYRSSSHARPALGVNQPEKPTALSITVQQLCRAPSQSDQRKLKDPIPQQRLLVTMATGCSPASARQTATPTRSGRTSENGT